MEENGLSYEVIGVAMEIHRHLGPWHPEEVYQRALQTALRRKGFDMRLSPKVLLKDPAGTLLAVYRPDLLLRDGERALMVVVRAEQEITNDHVRQVKAYLSAWRGPALGLLLNFGAAHLEWKKVKKE